MRRSNSELKLVLLILGAIGVSFGLSQYLRILNTNQGMCAFDCNWYCSIAKTGYSTLTLHDTGKLAFFPFFPSLLFLASKLIGQPCTSMAPWISLIGGALGIILFALYSKRQNHSPIAPLLLAFGPASLHMFMGYPEGLLSPMILFLLILAKEHQSQNQSEPKIKLYASTTAALVTLSKPDGALIPFLLGWFRLLPRQVAFAALAIFAVTLFAILSPHATITDYLGIQNSWLGQPKPHSPIELLSSSAMLYLFALGLLAFDIQQNSKHGDRLARRALRTLWVAGISCLVLLALDSRQGFYSFSRHLMAIWLIVIFTWSHTHSEARIKRGWIGWFALALSLIAIATNWLSFIQGSFMVDY